MNNFINLGIVLFFHCIRTFIRLQYKVSFLLKDDFGKNLATYLNTHNVISA